MHEIKAAIKIARDGLRSCYTEKGIQTGSRKVYWSWDSFFASFGALEIGDSEIVRKNLELYLNHQNDTGNIPKRIANPLYALKYLKLPISEKSSRQKPSYASPYYSGISISQCPVFIIALYQYVAKTKDQAFLKQNYKKLRKIFSFLSGHTYKSGLLKESVGGGWAESILKRGAITYTNMCYAQSLSCMSKMAEMVNSKNDAIKFKEKFEKIKKAIDSKLWEGSKGGFYSDWYGFSRHHHFNADGNLLALWWSLADKDKAKKINKKIDELLEESDPPIQQTSERYFFWRIFFVNQMSGLKHYHTRFSWLWLGCLAALAKIQIGEKQEALKIIEAISARIVENKTVHEIYFDGKPVKLFFYKSEEPWAWAAGLFLFACKRAGFSVK